MATHQSKIWGAYYVQGDYNKAGEIYFPGPGHHIIKTLPGKFPETKKTLRFLFNKGTDEQIEYDYIAIGRGDHVAIYPPRP